jgi:hypothetical protein
MDGPVGIFKGPTEAGCPQDSDGPQVGYDSPTEGTS